MFWTLADGTIETEPFKINGTEDEFRAWLDENWILAPGTEVSFDAQGRVIITYRTFPLTDGGEDFFFNTSGQGIVEISATRADRDTNDEWAFLAKDEPKAYMEDILPSIIETWNTGGIFVSWSGVDEEGEPVEGVGVKPSANAEMSLAR